MKAIDRLALGIIGLAGLTVACDGAKDPSAPQSLSAAVDDPAGDTYSTGASTGVLPDVVRFEASRVDTVLVVRIQFGSPMAPTARGGSNVVTGYVDIDADQNGGTGTQPATDVYRPAGSGSTGMSDEYLLSLWSEGQGRYEIWRTSDGAVTGTLLPLFNGNTLEMRIPLSALGGDDGHVNLAAVVGTLAEPTDIVPNDALLTVGQPARTTARATTARSFVTSTGKAIRWGR